MRNRTEVRTVVASQTQWPVSKQRKVIAISLRTSRKTLFMLARTDKLFCFHANTCFGLFSVTSSIFRLNCQGRQHLLLQSKTMAKIKFLPVEFSFLIFFSHYILIAPEIAFGSFSLAHSLILISVI